MRSSPSRWKTVTSIAILAVAAPIAKSAPSQAQSVMTTDAVGQAAYNSIRNSMSSGFLGVSKKCLQGLTSPRQIDIENADWRSEATFQQYVRLASTSTDLSSMFTHQAMLKHLDLDGKELDVRNFRDPWAANIARTERVGFVTADGRFQYHAIWRAFDKSGNLLGTYDIWMQKLGRSGQIFSMSLFSASSSSAARPLTKFCVRPGDIEAFAAREKQR